MSAEDSQLITEFIEKRISKEELRNRTFPGATDISAPLLAKLQNAYANNDESELDLCLILGARFGFDSSHVDILCKLLCEQWHHSHEDIATELEGLSAPSSVESLYKATLMKPDYLAYDNAHALAKKTIHALKNIRTAESLEALRLLCNSTDEFVARYAQRLLDRAMSE